MVSATHYNLTFCPEMGKCLVSKSQFCQKVDIEPLSSTI